MYSRLVLAFAVLGSTASAGVISHNFDGPVSVCGDGYSCPFIDAPYVPLFDPALGQFQKMSITFNVSGVALHGYRERSMGRPYPGGGSLYRRFEGHVLPIAVLLRPTRKSYLGGLECFYSSVIRNWRSVDGLSARESDSDLPNCLTLLRRTTRLSDSHFMVDLRMLAMTRSAYTARGVSVESIP